MKTIKNKNNILSLIFVVIFMSFTKKIHSKNYYDIINKKCKEIDNNIKNESYNRIRVFENDSRGPCEHILFYDKSGNLKKVELGAGDYSQTMYFYSYYFDQGLIFIDETKVIHDMEEYENESKTKTLTDKFYYKNNEIIKWIKFNKIVVHNKNEIHIKETNQLEIIDSYLYFKNKHISKKVYSGKGRFSKLLILNGKKIKIKLKYNIDDHDSKLVIYTSNKNDDLDKVLFSKHQPPKNQISEFIVNSIYAFKLRIRSNDTKVNWKIELEFEEIKD
ncbi:MAG: hypothetical protein GY830_05215 [Bacteroidetes bacterium]|nr:hypothetical protein [Bacteroidota bacterium]